MAHCWNVLNRQPYVLCNAQKNCDSFPLQQQKGNSKFAPGAPGEHCAKCEQGKRCTTKPPNIQTMHVLTQMRTSKRAECAVRAAVAEAGGSCSRPFGAGLPETLVGKGFWAVQLSPPSESSLLCPDATRSGPRRAEEERSRQQQQHARTP